MSEKHTPGPWTHDSGLVPPDGPERYADILADDSETIIARFNDLIPAGQANARLIAAAPDLLDLADASLNHLEAVAESGNATPFTYRLMADLRTAIAKATDQ